MPPREDDRDERPRRRRDDFEPEVDEEPELPLTPEERWSHVYHAGRRDGAREAKTNHRLDQMDRRITDMEDTFKSGMRWLLGIAAGVVGQLGLMLIAIVTYFVTKGGGP